MYVGMKCMRKQHRDEVSHACSLYLRNVTTKGLIMEVVNVCGSQYLSWLSPTYVFFIALGTEQYLAQCAAHSLEIGHPQ